MVASSAALLSAHGEVIPKSLFSTCGEQAENFTMCSRLTDQDVELNWVSSWVMLGSKSLRVMAMTSPQLPGILKKDQAMSDKQLWLEFYSDASQWWFHNTSDISARMRPFGSLPWVKAKLAAMIQGRAKSGDDPQTQVVDKCQALNRERLWQEFFADPSQWWDNRFDKKSSRSSDRRHKHTNDGLWIDRSNPPWLKAELSMIQVREQSDDGSSGLNNNWLNQAQLSTSTMTSAFERDPREYKKHSSGTSGDLWRLCKSGQLKEALHMVNHRGTLVDSNIYIYLLQECIKAKDLASGKQVHAHIVRSGFKANIFLLNTLINMYAKCQSMVDARQVFDNMLQRDMFTWSMMMAGYAKRGNAEEAFKIYEQMQGKGLMPDKVTFTCILNVCGSLGILEKGKEVHANILKAGIARDVILETALADMYVKCGSMKDAHQVFDNMGHRNVVSWSAMIAGYAQQGRGREALTIYEQMIQEGVAPNRVTFIGLLNACASIGVLEKGKKVHANILKAGIQPDIIMENTLVDMYAKCGSVEDARQVFNNMARQDLVSWNSMIAGYAQQGCGTEALQMYDQMRREGVMPDNVTFIGVLNACASLGILEEGKEVHADLVKATLPTSINLETALVDMYAKCGSVKDARLVFDNVARQDVGSWSAMIAGYTHLGCGREAFELYEQMIQEGVTPDKVTFTCVLNACASLGALEKGQKVHCDIMKAEIVQDVILGTALADMYASCGSVKDARQVFDNMAQRNVVSWNTMIAGYGQHGCTWEALKLFEKMKQEGLKPNAITFVCLISACSRVGLVDEGCHYFDSMSRDHALTPTMEHFGCMVDLFGRAGLLDEAEAFINKMPIEPDAGVWRTLLGACRIYGDVEIAERVANTILNKDTGHTTADVLLLNTCSS